jgi:hypothetical protein
MSNLEQLLRSLEPILNAGTYAFASLPPGTDWKGLGPIASMQEAEGITVVVPEEVAVKHGLPVLFRAAWITLAVQSDLQAVGLTAAFGGALARAGISCNVIAGAHHDHLFVPVEAAARAMVVLRVLQASGGA